MYVANLRHAADLFKRYGVRAVIEPINRQLGVVAGGPKLSPLKACTATSSTIPTMRAASWRWWAATTVFLHLDVYHMQPLEGHLADTIRNNIGILRHVQIAGVPGRHEPSVGEINYPYLFNLLDSWATPAGSVANHRPLGKTAPGVGLGCAYGICARRTRLRESATGARWLRRYGAKRFFGDARRRAERPPLARACSDPRDGHSVYHFNLLAAGAAENQSINAPGNPQRARQSAHTEAILGGAMRTSCDARHFPGVGGHCPGRVPERARRLERQGTTRPRSRNLSRLPSRGRARPSSISEKPTTGPGRAAGLYRRADLVPQGCRTEQRRRAETLAACTSSAKPSFSRTTPRRRRCAPARASRAESLSGVSRRVPVRVRQRRQRGPRPGCRPVRKSRPRAAMPTLRKRSAACTSSARRVTQDYEEAAKWNRKVAEQGRFVLPVSTRLCLRLRLRVCHRIRPRPQPGIARPRRPGRWPRHERSRLHVHAGYRRSEG